MSRQSTAKADRAIAEVIFESDRALNGEEIVKRAVARCRSVYAADMVPVIWEEGSQEGIWYANGDVIVENDNGLWEVAQSCETCGESMPASAMAYIRGDSYCEDCYTDVLDASYQ